MAGQYLASRGVDVNKEMARIQFDDNSSQTGEHAGRVLSKIIAARLPRQEAKELFDITIADGLVSSIERHDPNIPSSNHLQNVLDAHGQLLAPSLCHAHVHLDKCFLLQHPKYSDMTIESGSFKEAMELGAKAKERFEHDDLVTRGSRLIDESIEAGVTACRAFVEVDEVAEMKCVDAAVELKQKYGKACEIQICAFAQLALFSGEDGGAYRRELMQKAMQNPNVHVLGSTPYVEDGLDKMKQNIEWIVERAIEGEAHLDLHLDYSLESGSTPMIWHVLEELHRQKWATRNSTRSICLGHCTRLTLFTKEEWKKLQHASKGLPISFVGLPTSDLFMMGRPDAEDEKQGVRQRGTLQIPHVIEEYGFQGAIGINNVGNAFTPYGNCDPLTLACYGVGIYHAGTQKDTEMLYECVSTRAKQATGLGSAELEIRVGGQADFVLVGSHEKSRSERRAIWEVIYDPGPHRKTIYKGVLLGS